MEHFNYDNYIVSLLLNNDDIYVKIKNNITLQHFESKITTDLIKFNHLTLNGLFKIIKKCLLKENENYKILFFNNNNITMVVNINNDDLYEIKEEFIIKEIKLSTNNTNLLLNEKFNELQKQVNDIQTENITLKIKNINLQQEINNLQDCKFYIKVDNLISKTINDINQSYKNNIVLIDTKYIDNDELNKIFICTNDENFYNEIMNNDFTNLINKNPLLEIFNFLNHVKNNFIRNINNTIIYNNNYYCFSDSLGGGNKKLSNFIKRINIFGSLIFIDKDCYCGNIQNCKHKNLCDTIINNSKNFNTLVKEILINYVNLMIELYK